MNTQPDTWKRNKSVEIADCRVFKVRKDFCRRDADGAETTFFVIENPDWVNIIALTKDKKVVLIEQFRHGAEEIILEIPGGMVDAGESHIITAARELAEETGFAPREMILIGKSRPNPAIQNNWIYHYLALDCEQTSNTKFDEHESIATKIVPADEIENMITDGTITHSLVIAAFHFLEIYLKRSQEK
ncbi:MAG: NUDIX hydrolase [Pyrinomonadaceae bacterium]